MLLENDLFILWLYKNVCRLFPEGNDQIDCWSVKLNSAAVSEAEQDLSCLGRAFSEQTVALSIYCIQSSLQNDATAPEGGPIKFLHLLAPVALAIAEHPRALQSVLQENPLHGDDKENWPNISLHILKKVYIFAHLLIFEVQDFSSI